MDTETLEVTEQAPPADPRETESLRCMRRNALAGYLERMTLARRGPDGAAAVALTFGSHRLDLDPWESTVLQRALTGPTDADWPMLLAEGLAFQAKYLVESEATTEARSASRDQTLTNAAIGLSLLEETQRAINGMVLSGALDQAKKLSTFRNKIGHTVSTLKNRLGAQDYEHAESMAQEMVPELEQRTSTSRDAPVHLDELPSTTDGTAPGAGTKVRARAVEEADSTNYARPLILALLGLAVVWGVIVVPRLTQKSLPVVESQDLPRHEAIERVAARPPSLYIDIDAQVWTELSDEARLDLIDEIGAVIVEAGYTGAQFRTSEAGEVGRWLKQRGAELVAD